MPAYGIVVNRPNTYAWRLSDGGEHGTAVWSYSRPVMEREAAERNATAPNGVSYSVVTL